MGSSNRQGLMLVISAPSGTGKSTLVHMLTSEFPDLTFSTSYTTRGIRPGEVDGRDYHFVSMEEFSDLKEKGFFAESAEVHGNCYGTPIQATLDLLAKGRDVLFDIDVQGAIALKKNLGQGHFVFIFPPSLKTLEERLKKRGTDNEDAIARRLKNAPKEIARATLFDSWIVNDDLDLAYNDLKSVYTAEGVRPAYHPTLIQTILNVEE